MAHVLDLLAEVEGALSDAPSATRRPSRHAAAPAPMVGSGGASTSASAAPPPRVHAPAGDRNARRGKSEVDELLAMLDDEPGGPSLPRVPSSVHVRGSSTGSDAEPKGCGAGSKCTSVYLGAASAELGQTRATTRRACSELLCIGCDFVVLRFAGRQWSDRVDYMFFRNHMPSEAKLSAELRGSEGAASYCCQCSWATVLPSDSASACPPTPTAAASTPGAAAAGLLCIRRAGAPVPVSRASPADATPLVSSTEGTWVGAAAVGQASSSSSSALERPPLGRAGVPGWARRDSVPLADRVGGQGWTYWTCAGHA